MRQLTEDSPLGEKGETATVDGQQRRRETEPDWVSSQVVTLIPNRHILGSRITGSLGPREAIWASFFKVCATNHLCQKFVWMPSRSVDFVLFAGGRAQESVFCKPKDDYAP